MTDLFSYFMKGRTLVSSLRAAVGVVLGCLFLTGCVSRGPRFQKVTDSNKGYEFPDFTVKPPPGSDWYAMQTDPQIAEHWITFYKKLSARQYAATHSFFVSVRSQLVTNTFTDQRDFLKLARQWCDEEDTSRHKHLETLCEPDSRYGKYCAKFSIKVQDYGAPVGGSVLLMESAGYMFVHPDATNRLLVVTWSERGRSDELDPSLKEVGEKFIDGVEVTALK